MGTDFGVIQWRFAAPGALWLLLVPGFMVFLWVTRAIRRARDVEEMARQRVVPVRERMPIVGELWSWLFVSAALGSLVVALARPQALIERVRTAGVDLVILADASASMYVEDMRGSRWQRTTQFMTVFGDALRWDDDRIALAVFANIAAPQVRLTTDPNTFFFFLEHLREKPPFRLEDDQTWDTNAELGIHWGLRLIAKDEEISGRSTNAPVMVMISDGQVWSGEFRTALDSARARGIPVHVVGVGTSFGGWIPEPPPLPRVYVGGDQHDRDAPPAPTRSVLDRSSLRQIATAGGGQYFELDRTSDREIAQTILQATRRRAGARAAEMRLEELYWRFLLMASIFAGLGLVSLRSNEELLAMGAATACTVGVVSYFLW